MKSNQLFILKESGLAKRKNNTDISLVTLCK